jgi:hypothetical protein
MASRPDLTGISVSLDARADLRRWAATATGVLGYRVTMSDALRLAVAIATAHSADAVTEAAHICPNDD